MNDIKGLNETEDDEILDYLDYLEEYFEEEGEE